LWTKAISAGRLIAPAPSAKNQTNGALRISIYGSALQRGAGFYSKAEAVSRRAFTTLERQSGDRTMPRGCPIFFEIAFAFSSLGAQFWHVSRKNAIFEKYLLHPATGIIR
jgi:hypothetical protein